MHYIYALIDPRDKEIRYVGKTKNQHSRYLHHLRAARNGGTAYRDRWIRTLLKEGSQPLMEVIDVVSEDNWDEAERRWIKLFKEVGCRLTNMTDGGDVGGSWLGKKHKPATIEKMRLAATGRGHTEATKAKLAKAHAGRKPPPAAAIASSKRHKGVPKSAEARANMSKAQKGKLRGPMSDEQKAKISAFQKGRKHTPEHIARQAESHRRNNTLKKELHEQMATSESEDQGSGTYGTCCGNSRCSKCDGSSVSAGCPCQHSLHGSTCHCRLPDQG